MGCVCKWDVGCVRVGRGRGRGGGGGNCTCVLSEQLILGKTVQFSCFLDMPHCCSVFLLGCVCLCIQLTTLSYRCLCDYRHNMELTM